MRRIFFSISLVFFALIIGQYLHSPTRVVSQNNPPTPTPTTLPVVSKFTTRLPTSQNLPLPEISAKHIFIMDRESKMVLYAKAADDQIYPASTTKMMTALVVSQEFPLDTQLTVSQSYPDGVDIGLRAGETVTVENLLFAMLVQSANDAAEVLAAGFPGGREGFISAMNQKAQDLNLRNTYFKNPTGLDEIGHFSSASDLARLADFLMENVSLRRIVSTENAVVASVGMTDIHPVTNVNRLLGKIPGVLGVKTGFTDLAGESLVLYVNRDNREVIISLMGSTDRFTDATRLIDWTYSNFTWN